MRHRNSISAVRCLLYTLARALGDLQAVLKGPGALAKRLARSAAGRMTSRALWRLLK